MKTLIEEIKVFLKECGYSEYEKEEENFSVPRRAESSKELIREISLFLQEDAKTILKKPEEEKPKKENTEENSVPLSLFEIPKSEHHTPLKNNSQDTQKFLEIASQNSALLKMQERLQQEEASQKENFREIAVRLDEYIVRIQRGAEEFAQYQEHRQTASEAVNRFLKSPFMASMVQVIDNLYECLQKNSKDELCRELVTLLNEYLCKIGAYTYNGLKKGNFITEEQRRYFYIENFYLSDPSCHGKVEEISRLPYILEYYDYEIVRYCVLAGEVCILTKF